MNQRTSWVVGFLIATIATATWAGGRPPTAASPEKDDAYERHIYFNNGVHNDKGCPGPLSCVYERSADEPSNPWFPEYWISGWTMYRVFDNYQTNLPPYASPPEGMPTDSYEVSYGTTYYDNTYVPQDRDGYGAMMEHYEKRCLPIFPFDNKYTCSFVSLGNKAYFLTYDDRPKDMPPCCLFSPKNHPPRRNFIQHLPYNAEDSTHLDGSIQAYSTKIGPLKILFGYSFYKEATRDEFEDRNTGPYRHPQSFYFSGVPFLPNGEPFAPIVSQNYTNFRAQRPNPEETWDLVGEMCSATPPWCCLFADDCPDQAATEELLDASDGKRSTSGWDNLEGNRK